MLDEIHLIKLLTMAGTSTVNCAQINLQKSSVPSSQLSNRNEEIVFITEPFVKRRKVDSLPNNGHSIILACERSHRPRAALRLDRNLSPWLVEEFTDEDMCVAAVNVESRLVYVCSLYLDLSLIHI